MDNENPKLERLDPWILDYALSSPEEFTDKTEVYDWLIVATSQVFGKYDIPLDWPHNMKWAFLGFRLMFEHELSSLPKPKGRPRLADQEKTDLLRFQVVEIVRDKIYQDQKTSNRTCIAFLQKHSNMFGPAFEKANSNNQVARLFPKGATANLQNSVSRGKKISASLSQK